MDLAGSDGTVGPRLRLHRGAAVERAEHRPFCKGIVRAKKYYQGRHFCQMISYGHGTVAVVNPAIEGFVRQYLQDCRYPFSAFDTPHINCLHEEARKYGQALCFLAEYFLPEPSEPLLPVPDHLQIRLLYEDELLQLYPDKRFPMALGYTRTEPKKDVIAAVGYLGSEIVGVAGARDDCETMWQVGIDVLPTFRGRGYARALVDTLTREIMRLGKVPFYCTALVQHRLQTDRHQLRIPGCLGGIKCEGECLYRKNDPSF